MTELEFKKQQLHDLELLEISVQELPEVMVCNMLPKLLSESIGKEFGYTDSKQAGNEVTRRTYIGARKDINPSFIDNQKGVTIEAAAEMIYGVLKDYNNYLDYDFIRNCIMDILFAGSKKNFLDRYSVQDKIQDLRREIEQLKKNPDLPHIESNPEDYDSRIDARDDFIYQENFARLHKSQYRSIGFFNALYQFTWIKPATEVMIKKVKRPIHWRGTCKPRFLFVDLPPKRIVCNPPNSYKSKKSIHYELTQSRSAVIPKEQAISEIHDLFKFGTQKPEKKELTGKHIQFLIQYVSAGVIKYFLNNRTIGTKQEYTWLLLGKEISMYSILMECTKDDLQIICYKTGLQSSGNKSDIALRIEKYIQ